MDNNSHIIRILAISYLYPNSQYPNRGIFVLNRLKAVQKYCEVIVINPIPWFPFSSRFGLYKDFHRIPKKEVIEGIEVFHPRFFIIPRFFKFLDALTFTLAVVPLALKIKKTYLFNLIDLHWTYPDLLSGRILAKLLRIKQIVSVRGKEALYLEKFTIRSKLLNYLLVRSDFIITLSKELKNLCLSLGVHSKNIQSIRNGVDTDIFSFKEQNICRHQLGLPHNELVILTVGSLIYGKGFDRIIHALPKVLKKYPDTKLYVIGSEGPEGDYRKELHEAVLHFGLEKEVYFVGQVKNCDLVLWYNAADIFCLASRGEGSPNVLTEALACGCPAVATAVGSVPEILSQDFMGITVANNEVAIKSGLMAALSCKYDRQKISKFMLQYNWDWCAPKVMQIYQELLKNK